MGLTTLLGEIFLEIEIEEGKFTVRLTAKQARQWSRELKTAADHVVEWEFEKELEETFEIGKNEILKNRKKKKQ